MVTQVFVCKVKRIFSSVQYIYLTLSCMGNFQSHIFEREKNEFSDFFSFIGASATKSCKRSRISGVGCLKIFLVKVPKPQHGGGCTVVSQTLGHWIGSTTSPISTSLGVNVPGSKTRLYPCRVSWGIPYSDTTRENHSQQLLRTQWPICVILKFGGAIVH